MHPCSILLVNVFFLIMWRSPGKFISMWVFFELNRMLRWLAGTHRYTSMKECTYIFLNVRVCNRPGSGLPMQRRGSKSVPCALDAWQRASASSGVDRRQRSAHYAHYPSKTSTWALEELSAQAQSFSVIFLSDDSCRHLHLRSCWGTCWSFRISSLSLSSRGRM